MKKVPVTITLDEAVKIGNKEYNELTMEPPKGKHMRIVAGEQNQYAADIKIISALCGLNAMVEEFDDTPADAIIQLRGVLQGFLFPKGNIISEQVNLSESQAK
jgi:hypothetical protein